MVGLFSFVNTTFFSDIFVNYSLCTQPSYFKFSRSRLLGGHLQMMVYPHCSDVQVQVIDSYFGVNRPLLIELDVLTDSSVLVANSELNGDVIVTICFDQSCDVRSFRCRSKIVNFINFTKDTFKSRICNIQVVPRSSNTRFSPSNINLCSHICNRVLNQSKGLPHICHASECYIC